MRATHSPVARASGSSTKRPSAATPKSAAAAEQRIERVERDERQDDLGLVLDEVLERGVAVARPAPTPAMPTARRPASVASLDEAGAEVGEEADELAFGRREHQAVLAARHDPVDGGAAAAGLAGDVVERGLGDAPPGDAHERRVEDPRIEGAGRPRARWRPPDRRRASSDPSRPTATDPSGRSLARRSRHLPQWWRPSDETISAFLSHCQGSSVRLSPPWPGPRPAHRAPPGPRPGSGRATARPAATGGHPPRRPGCCGPRRGRWRR